MRRACLIAAAVAAAVVAGLPKIVQALYKHAAATSEDETLTSLITANSQTSRAFDQKRILLVGGTKGIGRGIAVALAEAGAHVTIVGRTGGDAVVQEMSRSNVEGQFAWIKADLSTIAGCRQLTADVAKNGKRLDALVMTVGVWPDWTNPLTADGYEKTIFIDVVARFAIFKGLNQAGLLHPDAQIVSVLASGQKVPPLCLFQLSHVKSLFRQIPLPARSDYAADILFMRTLASASVSGDAFLLEASARFPRMQFIGTMPGLVPTSIAAPTFGKKFVEVMMWLMLQLRVAMPAEQCALNHLKIMAAVRGAAAAGGEITGRLPTGGFWDHYLVGRTANKLSADVSFRNWLWKQLESISAGV